MKEIISQFLIRIPQYDKFVDNNIFYEDKKLCINLVTFDNDISNQTYLSDIKKTNSDNGYKTILIYEDEISYKQDIVVSEINSIFNNTNKTIINSDSIVIKEIYGTLKSIFLNENHLLGDDESTYTLGAFIGEELVAVGTFNILSETTFEYEFKRFCVKNNTIVMGVEYKFFDFFKSTFKVHKIALFHDNRWGFDENYHLHNKLKFELEKVIGSEYCYVKDGTRQPSHLFGKKKLEKNFPEFYNVNKTEKEIMESMGYKILYGIGRFKLTYDNSDKAIEVENNYLIYRISSNFSHKVYIGQTTRNFSIRYGEHKRMKRINQYLKSSFIKYGFDNFKFEIIDRATTIDELNDKEVYWVSFYNSAHRDFGYNIEYGGGKINVSDETRQKMSKSMKGKKHTEEHINKRKRFGNEHHCYGKTHSEEYKKNLSDKMKGKNGHWFGQKRDIPNMRKTKCEKYGKKVCQYNMDTGEIVGPIYDSIGQACAATKVMHGTINRHINKQVKKYLSNISWMEYTHPIENKEE